MTLSTRRFPTPAERALFALSIAGALVWAAAGWRGLTDDPPPLLLLAKTSVVAALALVAFGRRRELPGGVLFALALGAHAAGDLLLELSLLAGVAAFFAGHLGYLRLFWRERRTVDELGGDSKLALGLIALAAAGFVLRLAPRLAGVERVAIPIYIVALVTMAGSALVCRRGRPWVSLGAILFVASDALLSLGLFGSGVAGGRLLVWPLYVTAQLAIAWGWLGGGRAPSAAPSEPDAAPAQV